MARTKKIDNKNDKTDNKDDNKNVTDNKPDNKNETDKPNNSQLTNDSTIAADNVSNENVNAVPLKSKRGRKPKKVVENEIGNVKYTSELNVSDTSNNIAISILENDEQNDNILLISAKESSDAEDDDTIVEKQKPTGKKRGRKPKGGKIVQQIVSLNSLKEPKPNVILHLKCSMKDLDHNSFDSNNIESFNFSEANNNLCYEIIGSEKDLLYNKSQDNLIEDEMEYCDDNIKESKESDTKDLWRKLKILEHNLHINNISDKKSACFWCTYDFDNPPIYIPKHHIKDTYNVYGCFCSPECGVAFLMEENIDSSTKFERYYLLNHIYSKIYDYNKNIKPAPNPYYMLDKYYGNLNIQEYRSLLKNERLFLIVDKPLTRILPELHEDNDDFIMNNKIIPSNSYNIKRKLQKKQTKSNILTENFGLTQNS
jgi:hypothetical protein